jgi:uncharacterized protein
MELTCPKCQGVMRSYERNGVTVDQCKECRGIFLDRGELEKLVDAENSWHAEQQPEQPAPRQEQRYEQPAPQQQQQRYEQDPRKSYQQQGYSQQHHGGQKPRKKQSSFLEDLFG